MVVTQGHELDSFYHAPLEFSKIAKVLLVEFVGGDLYRGMSDLSLMGSSTHIIIY